MLACPAGALADTLPLPRGAYVRADASCTDPPNAVLRDFNGRGIGSSKAGQCRGRLLRRDGRRYVLRQDCVQYGGPDRRRAVERVAVRIDGAASYTDLADGRRYRWCRGLRL